MEDIARRKPASITVDRPAGVLRIVWQDGHQTAHTLKALRAACPCAECNEIRNNADPLRVLNSAAPDVSYVPVSAELVGNYALSIRWEDGHSTGIYTFASLRATCPCPDCTAARQAARPA